MYLIGQSRDTAVGLIATVNHPTQTCREQPTFLSKPSLVEQVRNVVSRFAAKWKSKPRYCKTAQGGNRPALNRAAMLSRFSQSLLCARSLL